MILLASALALDVALSLPADCYAHDRDCLVEVTVGQGGRPHPGGSVVLESRRGRRVEVLAPIGEPSPGRHWFRAPPDAVLAAKVDGEPPVALGAIELSAAPPASLADLPGVDTPVGSSVIKRFAVRRPVDPEQLLVTTSEGRVLTVAVEGDSLVVEIDPAPDRSARQVLVGVLDLTEPGAAVVWGSVRLRARQVADISVEPGNRVSVTIGNRHYGPFVADAAGAAHVEFEVLPGEASASIAASDDLGNTRTVQSPVSGGAGSVLAALTWPLPGESGVGLWVRAVRADGRTPDDRPPTCVGPDGALPLAWDDRGAWSGSWVRGASPAAPSDVGVECALGLASARARTRLGRGQPSRIVLRGYPESLASDFPLAQVQAWLEDTRGDRIAPAGLSLSARRGRLAQTTEDDVLRGEYNGTAAVAEGGDTLVAAWVAPPGAGAPWSLESWYAVGEGAARVRARVLDRAGRPLPGVTVTVTDGVSAIDANTDPRGFVESILPLSGDPLPVVSVRAGRLRRRMVLFPAEPSRLADLAAPDMVATLELPIRAGRVRQVFLDVSPRSLELGSGQHGEVSVQLLDAVGNVITGESVDLTTDTGAISAVVPRPDGTVTALFTPPERTSAASARITASAGLTSATVDVALVPRPVRGTIGADLGWISNFSSVSSPAVSLSSTFALPGIPSFLCARVGVGAWGADTQVDDVATGEAIEVRGQFFGGEIGPTVVSRTGRRVLEAGVSMAVVPYVLTVVYGGQAGISGGGISSPGPLLHAGAGYRFTGAEIYGEVRYLVAATEIGAVTFVGGVGGLTVSGGYRLVF